ncbi:hypothetical protein Taro_056048 [Colocasia esculenta]|uniref:Bifunctional inhibitor/plant lipid transfer protein/seed storage helical domain-containing protein n=1 Tax=Colocasia esculenta TaxID=4460 RepID=A0A843XW58_COLES|nr:hypothetical protein [Colocasia esculenta]
MVAAKSAWALVCAMAMAVAAALCTTAAGAAAAASPEKAAGPTPTLAPAGTVDCSSVIYGMMDCIDYVSPGSNASKPTATCCEGIKGVVKVSPWCLCDALCESAAMGIQLNTSRVAELPRTCRITVPDLDNCRGFLSPLAAPAPSEMEVSSPAPLMSAPASADGPGSSTATLQARGRQLRRPPPLPLSRCMASVL